MSIQFQTPILLITFNRPYHTRKVFDEIKKQRPRQLFVFQDGARNGNVKDEENCKVVRAVFEKPLDWDCELKTYYSEVNLGCGKGPATAISWFFDQVEQGIIFEDDCMPHPEFFEYCELLLERYSNDERMSFIGGSNFQDNRKRGKASYYFSAGHHATWGWATWRRTWKLFDYYHADIDSSTVKAILKKYFFNSIQLTYLYEIYEEVLKNRMNESCWDYQFYLSCWLNNKMAIVPNKNLISNIGFDSFGTHTLGENNKFAKIDTENILPLSHPKRFTINKTADFYMHKKYVQNYDYGWSGFLRIPYRMNKKIKKLVNHQGSWFQK